MKPPDRSTQSDAAVAGYWPKWQVNLSRWSFRVVTVGCLALFIWRYAQHPAAWFFVVGIGVASFILGFSFADQRPLRP